MTAEQLKAGPSRDLYGEMLAALRAWVDAYHPEAEYASVSVHLCDGVPDVQVPVISSVLPSYTSPPRGL